MSLPGIEGVIRSTSVKNAVGWNAVAKNVLSLSYIYGHAALTEGPRDFEGHWWKAKVIGLYRRLLVLKSTSIGGWGNRTSYKEGALIKVITSLWGYCRCKSSSRITVGAGYNLLFEQEPVKLRQEKLTGREALPLVLVCERPQCVNEVKTICLHQIVGDQAPAIWF